MKTFLLVGIDPAVIDFSAADIPPGMTADKLSAEIAALQSQFAAQGNHVDVCPIVLDASASARVSAQLARSTYDCILIGGGLRADAAIETLERIITAIHRHAPDSAVAFLKMPKDGAPAAARVLSRDYAQAGLLAPSATV